MAEERRVLLDSTGRPVSEPVEPGPVAERVIEERPVAERVIEERPVAERMIEERVVAERPVERAGDGLAAGRLVEDRLIEPQHDRLESIAPAHPLESTRTRSGVEAGVPLEPATSEPLLERGRSEAALPLRTALRPTRVRHALRAEPDTLPDQRRGSLPLEPTVLTDAHVTPTRVRRGDRVEPVAGEPLRQRTVTPAEPGERRLTARAEPAVDASTTAPRPTQGDGRSASDFQAPVSRARTTSTTPHSGGHGRFAADPSGIRQGGARFEQVGHTSRSIFDELSSACERAGDVGGDGDIGKAVDSKYTPNAKDGLDFLRQLTKTVAGDGSRVKQVAKVMDETSTTSSDVAGARKG